MDPGGEVNAFLDETRQKVTELECKLRDATTMLEALKVKLDGGSTRIETSVVEWAHGLEERRQARERLFGELAAFHKRRAPNSADALLAGNASPSHMSKPELEPQRAAASAFSEQTLPPPVPSPAAAAPTPSPVAIENSPHCLCYVQKYTRKAVRGIQQPRRWRMLYSHISGA